MKKATAFLVSLSLIIFLLSGCASTPATAQTNQITQSAVFNDSESGETTVLIVPTGILPEPSETEPASEENISPASTASNTPTAKPTAVPTAKPTKAAAEATTATTAAPAGANRWPAELSAGVANVWKPNLAALAGRAYNAHPLSGITVIIDPGHGGTDPGAVKNGISEKTLNLAVALLLKNELAGLGATVVMTRSTDVFTSLHRRAALTGQLIIKRYNQTLLDNGQDSSLIPPLQADMDSIIAANSDKEASQYRGIMYGYGACQDLRNVMDIESQYTDTLFLSLHSNSADNASWKGSMVYYSTRQSIYDGERTDVNAKMPRNPAYWYYNDIERQRLAKLLYSSITADIPEMSFSASNPVRSSNYAVLREHNLTGALIEMAYVSNTSDVAFISQPANQLRMAQAIAKGVYAFYCGGA